jgi:hypothetical protein
VHEHDREPRESLDPWEPRSSRGQQGGAEWPPRPGESPTSPAAIDVDRSRRGRKHRRCSGKIAETTDLIIAVAKN